MSKQASAAVIAAGTLWGIISIFIPTLSDAGLDSIQIAAVRTVIAAVFFSAVLAVGDKERLIIKLSDLWIFAGMGIISIVLFNCFYFYTMIHSQASVAVVLLYTSPVFVTLLSAIFFREKITPIKIISLITAFIGCTLVAGIFGSGYKVTPLILITGLASGLFYAMYTIFGRIALERYDTRTVTAYTFIFAAAGLIPICRINKIAALISDKPILIPWCLGIGFICTVLPYFLYTWGLRNLESGRAAILAAVEPLVGAVIGMTLFRENHGMFKLIGIAMIIAAIVLLNHDSVRKN